MESDAREKLEAELEQLKKELDERNASIPIQSIRPHQLIAIEELEDRIESIESRLKG